MIVKLGWVRRCDMTAGRGTPCCIPWVLDRENGSGHANGADAHDIYCIIIGNMLRIDDMHC